MKHKVTSSIVRQLYFAFIYSRINYGIQVYGSCADILMYRIQVLQNKLLKFFLNLDRRHSTDRLHADLKILKVKDIYQVNVIAFVNNCLLKKGSTLFHKYYAYQTHGYLVRQRNLTVPRPRIDIGEFSTKITGALMWNSLPITIKEKSRLKSFKKIVTKHFVQRY